MEAQYALLQQKSTNNNTLLQTKVQEAKQESSEKDSIIADKEASIKSAEKQIAQLKKDLADKDKAQSALLNSVKKALKGANTTNLQVEERNGRTYIKLNEDLLFPSGSATIDYQVRQNLKKLAQLINRNPSIDIIVEGHTDNMEMGSTTLYKNTWELSVARAAAVTRTLSVDFKVAPIRLVAAGRGDSYPINSNSTDEQRRRNRRVDIILMPKLDKVYNMLN
jgi:chemotaxis protein MotB